MHQPIAAAFWVGFGWMWPPEGQVFVAIPKKPWWFQRFLHVKHARLEEMIYKYVKNMGENHQEKILKLLIGRLLMFHFGWWRSLSQSQHPSLEKTAGTKVLQKLWPMDCFVHMVLSPPISCLMLTSSYPQGSKHNQFPRFTTDHCFVCWGCSSGGLRQCLSFKARNQFFNSGSGAPKKLNFTFFVVLSLNISEHCCWWFFKQIMVVVVRASVIWYPIGPEVNKAIKVDNDLESLFDTVGNLKQLRILDRSTVLSSSSQTSWCHWASLTVFQVTKIYEVVPGISRV